MDPSAGKRVIYERDPTTGSERLLKGTVQTGSEIKAAHDAWIRIQLDQYGAPNSAGPGSFGNPADGWVFGGYVPDEYSINYKPVPTWGVNIVTGQVGSLPGPNNGIQDDTLGFGLGAIGGKLLGSALGAVGRFFGRSGEAVFWSGRQGANRAAAEAYARATGGTTLEMTSAGRALEAQGAGIDAWRSASANFARGASGDVTAFAGGANPGSVWLTIERPLLMQNPNVTRIIVRDAVDTFKTTIIYPR